MSNNTQELSLPKSKIFINYIKGWLAGAIAASTAEFFSLPFDTVNIILII